MKSLHMVQEISFTLVWVVSQSHGILRELLHERIAVQKRDEISCAFMFLTPE